MEDSHRIPFFSRIATRLMLFNVLLLFLPLAGILYLGIYEDRLVERRMRSLAEHADLMAAAIGGDPWIDGVRARGMLERLADNREDSARLRVVLPTGVVIADSRPRALAASDPVHTKVREDWLYRVGSKLGRPLLRALRGDDPTLVEGDPFDRSGVFRGPEIESALAGTPIASKRLSGDQQSVTLYAAAPIRSRTGVAGVILASDQTSGILQDLAFVRLGILRIFLASIVAAAIVSLFVGTTIVGPLRRLSAEAIAITGRRGSLGHRFSGSEKHDEIGDLARSLERLTRRLESHVQFLETFATDVSHEFKNPLASIRTATEMLSEVDDPRERDRFRKSVERDIARMEHLLSGVREITTIDARLSNEQSTIVSVAALTEKIVDGFRSRSGQGVRFELSTEPTVPPVEASEDRLIQVLENLLDNAVGFSPAGATIHVEVSGNHDSVLVRISDEGPGIPEEHLERIFDRFFTWRPAEPKRSAHTGLGLAIARAIVEGYGGSLEAGNRPGGGASFEVRLPAAPAPAGH